MKLQLCFSFSVFSIEIVRSYTLKRYDMGKGWTTILDHVVSFERSGKFLYASVLTDPNNIVSISDTRLVVRKSDFVQ